MCYVAISRRDRTGSSERKSILVASQDGNGRFGLGETVIMNETEWKAIAVIGRAKTRESTRTRRQLFATMKPLWDVVMYRLEKRRGTPDFFQHLSNVSPDYGTHRIKNLTVTFVST